MVAATGFLTLLKTRLTPDPPARMLPPARVMVTAWLEMLVTDAVPEKFSLTRVVAVGVLSVNPSGKVNTILPSVGIGLVVTKTNVWSSTTSAPLVLGVRVTEVSGPGVTVCVCVALVQSGLLAGSSAAVMMGDPETVSL
jgi:hypothetical protein